MLKEQQDTLKKEFSMTPTYAVRLTEQSGTTAKLEMKGQYDSKLAWHEQTAGSFVGWSNDETSTNAFFFFNLRGHSAQISGKDYIVMYTVTDITEDTINCRDENGNSRSFSYITAGTDEDPVVTITVEAGKTIECTWVPSDIIGEY